MKKKFVLGGAILFLAGTLLAVQIPNQTGDKLLNPEIGRRINAAVIVPATEPSFPPVPIVNLYRPLDTIIRSIVGPAEAGLQKDAADMTDLERYTCLDGLKQSIIKLREQPVFIRFYVLEVQLRTDDSFPLPLNVKSHMKGYLVNFLPEYPVMVKGILEGRSSEVMTKEEKQQISKADFEAQSAYTQRGLWPNEGEVAKSVSSKAVGMHREADLRRPYPEVYILMRAETCKTWKEKEQHVVRGAVLGGGAFYYPDRGSLEACGVGLELLVAEETRPVQPYKAPQKVTTAPAAPPTTAPAKSTHSPNIVLEPDPAPAK